MADTSTSTPAGGRPKRRAAPKRAAASRRRRPAAASAPEAEQRYRDLVELMPGWAWETGPDLRFTYLSERFEEVAGLPAARFLGRTPLEAAGANLRDPVWQRHVEDFMAQRPFRDFQYTLTDAEGRPRRVSVNGKPVFGPDGRFQGYRGTGADITASTLADENLHAVKARLEHLLDTSPAMIFSFKAGGDHAATFASNNIRQQLGHEPQAFLDDPDFWTDHIHPEDRERVMAGAAKVFEADHTVQEYRFRHADGGYRWMRDELVLVREPDGTPQEVVGYWVDITDRKRAEDALQEYAERLEFSNRELEDFAYVASHDLQEPLRKIEAFGDRLRVKCGEALSDDGRLYLDRMQQAATRMRTLINDLLTYSRVTTKAQPFEPVSLADIARDAVSDLHARIEETGGRVDLAELPTIEADPTQIRQLLQNLIGNGLKFRREDAAPVVRVSATADPEPADAAFGGEGANGHMCHLTIADNGIGFDEKYVDRIFNIFQRLHGRTEYEGTGIGLATCRKIVERHGGRIAAKSAPGEGATFTVSLPLRQANQEQS